jgi:hypothetical protein
MSQVTTIYVAFGVLMAIIYMLMSIYPALSSIDISVLGGAPKLNDNTGKQSVAFARMGEVLIKQRFFHLSLINSIGAGLLIGKLVNGKMKYGLLHSLVLVAATVGVFVLLIF